MMCLEVIGHPEADVVMIVKLRLQGQFFTRDCNAILRNSCVASNGTKIATQLHGALAIFADRKIARVLHLNRLDFSESGLVGRRDGGRI